MINKLPCTKCLILPICINKKKLYCKLLLDYLTKSEKVCKYPEWPNIIDKLRETLRGNWCVVGNNDKFTMVEKDRKVQVYSIFREH